MMAYQFPNFLSLLSILFPQSFHHLHTTLTPSLPRESWRFFHPSLGRSTRSSSSSQSLPAWPHRPPTTVSTTNPPLSCGASTSSPSSPGITSPVRRT
ncbi:hypothetical protein IWZ00DRAFT_516972 [Phyllosticta capitalensis]